MNSKSLIACLAILGCVSVTNVAVQAQEKPEPKVEQSKENIRDLELGSRAPAKFQRPEAGMKDWSKHGLKAPSKEAQWVKINDKYVMVQITNGQITEIVPIRK
ncbi:lipoprotein [Pseudomonas syringae]|uniref:Lipoprotein n=1 Tax=Pseudomonas syringae TaxID=317 RepID=A0A1C7Z3P3_PSESX|nr:RcnB family protein [Pseudomonas syringae]OCR24019.1 lipoprotein [Pseudomonas syringae]